jgi:mono/diheme cytochrome c family protein
MQLKSRNAPKASNAIIGFLFTIPLLASLTACGGNLELNGSNDKLTSAQVTSSRDIVMPDDDPSVPDGKAVWNRLASNPELNCASCHGTGGEGGAKASVNFTDKEFMRKLKPVEQFETVWLGKTKDGKNSHPAVHGVVSNRDAWDLVFYVRSLAVAPLTDKEVLDVSAVFGSNCAVCHGTKGYGDGPLAHSLEPQPANFQRFDRFYDREDDVLWDHIANGIKWEGMPNFLDKEDKAKNVKFDKEYIWKLVQYVRHFHESTESTIASNTADKK